MSHDPQARAVARIRWIAGLGPVAAPIAAVMLATAPARAELGAAPRGMELQRPELRGAEQGGAEVWIERLGAPEAAVRDRAQRWLAAHLGPGDLPAVVRSLRSGDAEVRRRLTDALAADDRRLGLAAVLHADALPAVRGAGEAALRQMLAAWCAPCAARGLDREGVRRALDSAPPDLLRLEAGEHAPAVLLERLGRLAGLPAPLALDPELRALGARRHAGAVGDGFELLESALDAFGLEVEGFGFGERGELGPASWLHVTRRGLEGLATGHELLLGAVLRVQAGGAEAPAAARLLAVCGWPAALHWLEERWLRGDAAALDALLGAAALGRVAPALATPRGQALALERAELRRARGEAGGREQLERTARGLAGTGPIGPRGEDLDAALLAEGGFRAEPAALWARLVVLEGRQGGSAAVRAHLEELAGRGDLAPFLRLQVARALAAQAPAAPPRPGEQGTDRSRAPAGLVELARWAEGAGRGLELARLAAILGWGPPPGLGAAAEADPRLAVLLADWLHATGDPAAAAARLASAAARLEGDADLRERAVETLRAWSAREGRPATEALLEPELARGPAGAALTRLATRAGVLSAARQGALLEALLDAPVEPADLELVGHLAAGLRGAAARNLLLERLAEEAGLAEPREGPTARGPTVEGPTAESPLAAGLSAAAAALARARQDEALAIFLREVWRRLPPGRDHALFERLAPPSWPPPAAPPRDGLGGLDRTLDGLPR